MLILLRNAILVQIDFLFLFSKRYECTGKNANDIITHGFFISEVLGSNPVFKKE